jgi:hypothetical protein
MASAGDALRALEEGKRKKEKLRIKKRKKREG